REQRRAPAARRVEAPGRNRGRPCRQSLPDRGAGPPLSGRGRRGVGSDRERGLACRLRSRAGASRLLDLQGRRVLALAVAPGARSGTGRERARSHGRPDRHRHGARPRHPQSLSGIGRCGHPRRASTRRRGDLPRPDVPGHRRGLAHQPRKGARAAERSPRARRAPGSVRLEQDPTMTAHKIGTRAEWLVAREQLLIREKEHTRVGDELARQRRELPWVPVEKDYRFDSDDGKKALGELFDGRRQLLVYHFMFGPDYTAGCTTCSSIADGVNGVVPHLNARDVTMLFVSQAPLEKLRSYKRRMGWSFPWVSSANSEFNADLGFSNSEEQTRAWVAPILEQLPPIAARNARDSGTDVVHYLTESQGFSAFILEDGVV